MGVSSPRPRDLVTPSVLSVTGILAYRHRKEFRLTAATMAPRRARNSARLRIVSNFSQLFFRFLGQRVKQVLRVVIYGGNRSDYRGVQNSSQPLAKLLALLLTRTRDFILPSALAVLPVRANLICN